MIIGFLKSKTLTGFIVRLLVSVRYGIPFKSALSHVYVRYGLRKSSGELMRGSIVSAEPTGLKVLKEDAFDNPKFQAEEFEVILSPEQTVGVFRNLERILRDSPKYAFGRYLMDALKILLFFGAAGIIGLFASGYTHTALKTVCFWIALLIVYAVAVPFDLKTSDCAEVVSETFWGVFYPLGGKHRNSSPDSIYSVVMTLRKFGKVFPVENTRGDD